MTLTIEMVPAILLLALLVGISGVMVSEREPQSLFAMWAIVGLIFGIGACFGAAL